MKKVTKNVIGPVWEANHVWLIITIVVLFIAFPLAFPALCIHLHFPLFLLLIAILVRGAAFSFRHYDPYFDRSHKIHDLMFYGSSLVGPILFGMILTALLSPFPTAEGYFANYIAPFISVKALVGEVFILFLFTYTAWVLLLSDPDATPVYEALLSIKKGLVAFTLLSGACGYWVVVGDQPWPPFAWAALALTLTLLLLPTLYQGKWATRLSIAGAHLGVIALYVLHSFPVVIQSEQARYTWLSAAAPSHVLWLLFSVLVLGLLIIIPNLLYLLSVFKRESTN